MNAWNDQFSDDLLAAIRAVTDDPDIRAVAVTGAGRAFSSGLDLKEAAEQAGDSLIDVYGLLTERYHPLITGLRLMPKPVIAAVNGPAFAGGMGLAGMCDIVIAVRSARFAMPEAKIGLFPMIIVAHLARSMPRKPLLEMMLTGDPIDAAEAHRLGFVTRVVDDVEQMEAVVQDYAAKFEAVSPAAVRLGRRAFTLMADMTADQALEAAQFMNVPFFHGDDLAEGAAAFLEKRPPSWRQGGR
jgi:enoyl-CoA hydratase/carnithine racemase